MSSAQREIAEAKKVRYQQLLISIEGKQSTCCLKVLSPRRKSRSALLAFRGRALGCLYGRKDMQGQLLGVDAFGPFLDDLSIEDSIVDTYILSEELALAAGSLFHGDVFNQPAHLNAVDTFHFVYQNLITTQMPGCIVLKRFASEEVIAFIYVFNGQIAGVFTFADGWLSSTYEQAVELIESNLTIRVSASKLNACNVEEVFDMSFSLTGMDRPSVYMPTLRPMDMYV